MLYTLLCLFVIGCTVALTVLSFKFGTRILKETGEKDAITALKASTLFIGVCALLSVIAVL